MLITVMRSKLHRLTITQADLNCVGSITIDEDLLDAAGLFVAYGILSLEEAQTFTPTVVFPVTDTNKLK